ncbi:uncharacterized protein LOC121320986 isoform X1 [Polyodon spathula]|uniref:uncharacterized protein LOC121320986 isoform X1 n=1 Tax=Polyodon spathula TaxID=7913 RepID=UPI001B7F6E09|nr:uncharacterized protein LOC121320986 isoform X1 [Polyodon spathula]
MNRLFLLNALFCIAYEIPAQRIVQPHLSVTAQLGESVTLECSTSHIQHGTFFLFKQVIGQPPKYMVIYDGQSKPTFLGEFINNSRFKTQTNAGSFTLTILKMESSDVAVYYCAELRDSRMHFRTGTALLLKGIESRGGILQPPLSESMQSYYCALVTCGEDSTGNETEEDSKGRNQNSPNVVICSLAATSIFLLISIAALLCTRTRARKCKPLAGNVAAQAAQTNADATNDQNQQMLDYAALDFDQRRNKPGKKKREVNKESVYTEVRVQQRE